MATQPRDNFDFEEQRARIVRMIEETEKFTAEQKKLRAEEAKLAKDTSFAPWVVAIQGLLAGAAIMGAGIAFAKLFLG